MRVFIFLLGIVAFVVAYWTGFIFQRNYYVFVFLIAYIPWIWYLILSEYYKLHVLSQKVIEGEATIGEYQYVRRLQDRGIDIWYLLKRLAQFSVIMGLMAWVVIDPNVDYACLRGEYQCEHELAIKIIAAREKDRAEQRAKDEEYRAMHGRGKYEGSR